MNWKRNITLAASIASAALFISAMAMPSFVSPDGSRREKRQKKRVELSYQNKKRVQKFLRDSSFTTIGLPPEKQFQAPEIANPGNANKDTIKIVDFEGKEMFLMKTVQDEDGNSVANQVLDAAVVTARFRHTAERNGKVDLEFQLVVPESMLESHWQLRYQPVMFVMGDSTQLERVFLTGKDYRKKQLRGYEQYNKWLRKIITDSTAFVDIDRLEIFLQRNIPQIYTFKSDTSYVSDEEFMGVFDVTETEAIDHYTRRWMIRRNDHLIAQKGKKFSQYVKSPLVTENLRLDTVLTVNGNYVYNYVQELDLRGKSKLKKVDIVLDGEIYEQGDFVYKIPRTEPLTFYISSISAFVDGTERYITRVIERRVTANRDYKIDFKEGKWEILPDYNNNASAIQEVKDQLSVLLKSDVFDVDSVVVTATASPEGKISANETLSKRRGESISAYFNQYMKTLTDSLNREEGLSFNLDDTYEDAQRTVHKPVRFTSHYYGENWQGLHVLVEADSVLTVTNKEDYYTLCDIEDLDEREDAMKKEPWYKHMRDNLYPQLRTVKFAFNLARKGMFNKDTLVTTEVDRVYMDGVQAIRDRDYERAVELLASYNDYNTAIAYAALDRNHSALAILEKCEKTAPVNYMLAIIYSRFGEDQKAVQAYMDACHQNSQYIHRGNLDPEISVLIKKYDLNKQEEEDYGF